MRPFSFPLRSAPFLRLLTPLLADLLLSTLNFNTSLLELRVTSPFIEPLIGSDPIRFIGNERRREDRAGLSLLDATRLDATRLDPQRVQCRTVQCSAVESSRAECRSAFSAYVIISFHIIRSCSKPHTHTTIITF